MPKGKKYQSSGAQLVAKMVSDLMLGTDTAGPQLRDLLDNAIALEGLKEDAADKLLEYFPQAWALITKTAAVGASKWTLTAETKGEV